MNLILKSKCTACCKITSHMTRLGGLGHVTTDPQNAKSWILDGSLNVCVKQTTINISCKSAKND